MTLFERRGARVYIAAALLSFAAATPASTPPAETVRALIVGGGPTAQSNQVAIESNVRYMLRVLPNETPRTVLFANGDPKSSIVLFESKVKSVSPAEHTLNLILKGRNGADESTERFRAPNLAQLDGASKKPEIDRAFSTLQSASGPVLLYFTGHGSPAADRNLDNNVYDLWGDKLSVRELASKIAALPQGSPVTVIMVQCFSGAFGNLLFEGGSPTGELVDRDIVGYFAAIKERMAAGCTPEVDEAEYHDFTGYFFAALTGRDRVGRRVTGADYNHDGTVGMDEAYFYTLGHDRSIDVPVCTSDVFLRRFVKTPADADIFKTAYSSVAGWASPGQKAALDDLSAALNMTGEDRLQTAYTRFLGSGQSPQGALNATRRAFRTAEGEAKQRLLSRWPDLKDETTPGYKAARAEAIAAIQQHRDDAKFDDLLKADEALNQAEQRDYEREMTDAKLIRYVRLAKSVVLAHSLREGTDETLKRRYERLVAAESRPLITRDRTAAR